MSAYYYREADGPALPLVVSIPHTGTEVPPSIQSRFASPEIAALPTTDWHLHDLYDFLPRLGIPTIYARYSRFVIDLNRPPDGMPLYPGRFETSLVPTTTFNGEAVFATQPGEQEIERLRVAYHEPYHQKLRDLLEQTIKEHGRVVLVDCHSVASAANKIHAALSADIYLGDRDGTSCDTWITDTLAASFVAGGLEVNRNDPYKGGFITTHYGSWPAVDAVQIEMCQRLYMDERNPLSPREQRFADTRGVLIEVFSHLARALEWN